MFVPSQVTILHADVDAFFASVAQRDSPELRGKPVIVGGGVVMACSYEAKALGVRSAMGASRWKRLCPDAIVVSPDFEAYSAASKELFRAFRDTSPLVEGLSLEEAFLDVTGLERISGPPLAIARRLRARVRDEVGLPLSVGIARTKVLAKMASREAKPDGIFTVEPAGEREFLHALPVERVWGIGDKTAAKLHREGIATVGQIAALSENAMIGLLGKASGRHVFALATNRERRPRVRSRGRRSLGSQCGFGLRRVNAPEALDPILLSIVDRVTRRLRSGDWVGRTAILRLRYGDYTRATRSVTLERPTSSAETVLAATRALLEAEMPEIRERGLTLLGLTMTNLISTAYGIQLELPFGRRGGPALEAALDEVRMRYGNTAVVRGTLVGRSDGPRPEPGQRDHLG